MIPPTAEVLLVASGPVERTHYIIYAWYNGKMHVATAAVASLKGQYSGREKTGCQPY